MPYTKHWGSAFPGCLILLIDQSGTMGVPFGGTQLGAGRRKSDAVAVVVNNLLHEFVRANTVGATVKPRAEISVWGYGGYGIRPLLPGNLSSKTFVHLSELNQNPLRIEVRTKKEMDDTGNIIEFPVYFPVWIEPAFEGVNKPMCTAIERAAETAEQWIKFHPNNYPPLIINITDGSPTDGDIRKAVRDLLQSRTSDGGVLLFNCHLSDKTERTIEFPNSEAVLPSDGFARVLFAVSSVIPDSARNNISESTGNSLPPGARGYILNGDAGSIRLMFTFATVGARAR